MPDMQNPFDQFLTPQTSAPTADAGPGGTAPAENNPFDQFVPQGATPPQTSAFGAFARHAISGVLPALGGLAAAGAGAEVGGEAGALAGAAAGSIIPGLGTAIGGAVGGTVGGIGGGLAGFFGGAQIASTVQGYATSKLPISWQDQLGTSDRQQQIDEQQHPVASFLGGLAPYALTMS